MAAMSETYIVAVFLFVCLFVLLLFWKVTLDRREIVDTFLDSAIMFVF